MDRCIICGEEIGYESHYHCGNCGKLGGMFGCSKLDEKTQTSRFTCTRPAWWQQHLDEEGDSNDEG